MFLSLEAALCAVLMTTVWIIRVMLGVYSAPQEDRTAPPARLVVLPAQVPRQGRPQSRAPNVVLLCYFVIVGSFSAAADQRGPESTSEAFVFPFLKVEIIRSYVFMSVHVFMCYLKRLNSN